MKIEAFCRRILRKIARTVVRFPAKWYFNRRFKTAFTDDYDAFWVVDIDNTIADSWRIMTPQYKDVFRSQSDKMMSIAPFESMQKLIQNAPPRTRIIFLTARQYIRYFVTKRWLKKHGFLKSDSVVVLVEWMRDKAPLLENVINENFIKKGTPQYMAYKDIPNIGKGDFEPLLTLNNLKSTTYPIIYFDDLSYNHENGVVLYYDEVINAVKKIPILHIGYDELLTLQSPK